MAPQTLYDKLWSDHLIKTYEDGRSLLYIDGHLLHEVSTPQSFLALEERGLGPRRTDANLAMADHAVPTTDRSLPIRNPRARAQTDRLIENVNRHGIPYLPLQDARQGIVHVVGPEQGFTLPGMTLVCGDSHTSTHGALAALAFGIGASECGIVLATQSLVQRKAKTFLVRLEGRRPAGVSAKDIALTLISRIKANGAAGYAIEFAGDLADQLEIEERMTLCNMAIEAGARVALFAPDERTFAWIKGRPMAPTGAAWDKAVASWMSLRSDPGARYDRSIVLDASALTPFVTWGTSPEEGVAIDGCVPDPASEPDTKRRERMSRAQKYMGVAPGQPLDGLSIDRVFIGSCTNGRLSDLVEAAAVLRGRKLAPHVQGMVVPGSGLVKRQAEDLGLDRVFRAAGFEWREAGCSMCVAMNGDTLSKGMRCASTSNRNFEGRQGRGARTHLVSPAMAAAAGVAGHLTDVRRFRVAASIKGNA